MLTSARNPFEIVMIIAGLLAGIAGLLVIPWAHDYQIQCQTIPESCQIAYGAQWQTIYGMGPPWTQMFSVCLILGTGTVVLSLFLQSPVTTLQIERVGMILLAALFLPYGVLLGIGVWFLLYPVTVLIIGYGVACAARVLQITRDLRRYRQELRRITSGSP